MAHSAPEHQSAPAGVSERPLKDNEHLTKNGHSHDIEKRSNDTQRSIDAVLGWGRTLIEAAKAGIRAVPGWGRTAIKAVKAGILLELAFTITPAEYAAILKQFEEKTKHTAVIREKVPVMEELFNEFCEAKDRKEELLKGLPEGSLKGSFKGSFKGNLLRASLFTKVGLWHEVTP